MQFLFTAFLGSALKLVFEKLTDVEFMVKNQQKQLKIMDEKLSNLMEHNRLKKRKIEGYPEELNKLPVTSEKEMEDLEKNLDSEEHFEVFVSIIYFTYFSILD